MDFIKSLDFKTIFPWAILVLIYILWRRAYFYYQKNGAKFKSGFWSWEENGMLALHISLIKFADFKGKASRQEFWFFILFTIALSIGIYLIFDPHLFGGGQIGINIFSLVLAIPQISLATRRLHDTGRSGWWQLLGLTVIGMIPLIIWWASESSSTKKNKSSTNESDTAKKLRELNKLYKENILTKEEFTEAKKKYLK